MGLFDFFFGSFGAAGAQVTQAVTASQPTTSGGTTYAAQAPAPVQAYSAPSGSSYTAPATQSYLAAQSAGADRSPYVAPPTMAAIESPTFKPGSRAAEFYGSGAPLPEMSGRAAQYYAPQSPGLPNYLSAVSGGQRGAVPTPTYIPRGDSAAGIAYEVVMGGGVVDPNLAVKSARQGLAVPEWGISGVPNQSIIPTRDLSSNAPTRFENMQQYSQWDMMALENARNRPGFYPASSLGDSQTQAAIKANAQMRGLGFAVASDDAILGRTLEAQRQAAFGTLGSKDDRFFSGEFQKWIENKVETSSAYHHVGMKSGIPIPANRFEYQGDLAVEFLKGQPRKDSERFSPVSGEMSLSLPQFGGRGEGVQDYAWRLTEEGKIGAGRVSYSPAVEKLLSAEGKYSVYGDLWGGKKDAPSAISPTSTTTQVKGSSADFVPTSAAGVEVGMGLGMIPKPFTSVGKEAQPPTPGGSSFTEKYWSTWDRKKANASPDEFDLSRGLIGGLFPEITSEQLTAYQNANRSRNPLVVGYENVAEGTRYAKSSALGALDYFSGGLSGKIWAPETFVTQKATAPVFENTGEAPTVTRTGGSESIRSLGGWLKDKDVELGKRGSGLNLYDKKAVDAYNLDVSEYNIKRDMFITMDKENPTFDVTTTNQRLVAGTGLPEVRKNQWELFTDQSGKVARLLYGTNLKQMELDEQDVMSRQGLGGDVDRVNFGVKKFMLTEPANLAPAAIQGAAFLYGGGALGGATGLIANSGSRAAPIAKWLVSPTGQTVVKSAVGLGFAGLYGYGVTEGGTASRQKIEVNVGSSLPPLAAMMGGGGGFNWLGEVRASRITTPSGGSSTGVFIGDQFFGGGKTPQGKSFAWVGNLDTGLYNPTWGGKKVTPVAASEQIPREPMGLPSGSPPEGTIFNEAVRMESPAPPKAYQMNLQAEGGGGAVGTVGMFDLSAKFPPVPEGYTRIGHVTDLSRNIKTSQWVQSRPMLDAVIQKLAPSRLESIQSKGLKIVGDLEHTSVDLTGGGIQYGSAPGASRQTWLDAAKDTYLKGADPRAATYKSYTVFGNDILFFDVKPDMYSKQSNLFDSNMGEHIVPLYTGSESYVGKTTFEELAMWGEQVTSKAPTVKKYGMDVTPGFDEVASMVKPDASGVIPRPVGYGFDNIAGVLQQERGFTSKPTVLPKSEFEASGGIEIYRGVGSKKAVDAFTTGDTLIARSGIFGAGTYFTGSSKVAAGFGKNVIAAKLKPGAKVIELKDLLAKMSDSGLWKEADTDPYASVLTNPGRFAIANNYDAIYGEKTGYYNILNRGAVIVPESPPAGQSIWGRISGVFGGKAENPSSKLYKSGFGKPEPQKFYLPTQEQIQEVVVRRFIKEHKDSPFEHLLAWDKYGRTVVEKTDLKVNSVSTTPVETAQIVYNAVGQVHTHPSAHQSSLSPRDVENVWLNRLARSVVTTSSGASYTVSSKDSQKGSFPRVPEIVADHYMDMSYQKVSSELSRMKNPDSFVPTTGLLSVDKPSGVTLNSPGDSWMDYKFTNEITHRGNRELAEAHNYDYTYTPPNESNFDSMGHPILPDVDVSRMTITKVKGSSDTPLFERSLGGIKNYKDIGSVQSQEGTIKRARGKIVSPGYVGRISGTTTKVTTKTLTNDYVGGFSKFTTGYGGSGFGGDIGGGGGGGVASRTRSIPTVKPITITESKTTTVPISRSRVAYKFEGRAEPASRSAASSRANARAEALAASEAKAKSKMDADAMGFVLVESGVGSSTAAKVKPKAKSISYNTMDYDASIYSESETVFGGGAIALQSPSSRNTGMSGYQATPSGISLSREFSGSRALSSPASDSRALSESVSRTMGVSKAGSGSTALSVAIAGVLSMSSVGSRSISTFDSSTRSISEYTSRAQSIVEPTPKSTSVSKPSPLFDITPYTEPRRTIEPKPKTETKPYVETKPFIETKPYKEIIPPFVPVIPPLGFFLPSLGGSSPNTSSPRGGTRAHREVINIASSLDFFNRPAPRQRAAPRQKATRNINRSSIMNMKPQKRSKKGGNLW